MTHAEAKRLVAQLRAKFGDVPAVLAMCPELRAAADPLHLSALEFMRWADGTDTREALLNPPPEGPDLTELMNGGPMVTNDTLPLAREAAANIANYYQVPALLQQLAAIGNGYADLCNQVANIEAAKCSAELAVADAEVAVKEREAELLTTVDGKNETERKANHVQAKKADEQLATMKANVKVVVSALVAVEQQLAVAKAAVETRRFELRRLEAACQLASACLSAVGSVL